MLQQSVACRLALRVIASEDTRGCFFAFTAFW